MFWSIETAYNGTLYRSRTEARYALMFDRAFIEFQYEPEAFAFEEKGERYLPDFWVPEWDSFFEVKRDGFRLEPGDWNPERNRCELLMEATEKEVFLAPGSPAPLLKLRRFQPYRLGFIEVDLSDMVPVNAIMTAKSHRFDWRKIRRDRPRPIFTGDGAIGDHAESLLKRLKPNGDGR